MSRLLSRLISRAHPIGIDLGASQVKVLQLGGGPTGLRLIGMLRLDLEEEIEDDGAPLDAALRSVGRRVIAGRFSGRECVVAVDDRLLRTRAFRQPRMPEAEIDAAVRLDAAQRLGFAEDEECEVGWIRAGEVHQNDEVRNEIIYLGAPRAPLERIAMGLASSGLRPIGIEPGFVAATRCFGRTLRRAADLSVVRVIVDVGHRSTGVVLTRGSRVAFYKPLELGGSDMVHVAAERLGLEEDTVRDLRRQRMAQAGGGESGIDSKVDRALYDAVRPLLGDLAHEVNLCVRHFSVTFRGSRPSACHVVGGEALEPHLAEAIQDALQISTTVGCPLEGVEGVGSIEGGVGSHVFPEWTVAAGLSLRALDQGSSRVRAGARRVSDWGEEEPVEPEARGAA